MTSIALVLTFQLGPQALAAPFAEVGDAGNVPARAQQPLGTGALTSIPGTLSAPLDEDVFRICLTGGRTFAATTVGTPGTVFDTQLFLFDQNGIGVEANDDVPGTVRSTLPAGGLSPAAAGVYYLAITAFDDDATSNTPASPAGLIFPSFPFTSVFGPTGPGGALPLADWTGNSGQTGTYTINLTGAVFCQPNVVCTAVPPPPSGAILGTSGVNNLVGTNGPDVFYARGGNDRIVGLGGDDLIFADSGNDLVSAGDGNDTICGGPGDDLVAGENGNDVVSGDAGADRITGDAGNDLVLGGPDADRLAGGLGKDVCRTGGNPGDLAETCETLTA